MSTQSSIEWTDTTWNPVRGCSKVSRGCEHCYAMKQAHRFSGPGQPYEGLTKLVPGKGPQWTGAVRLVPEMLDQPLRWRKPRRVFVNSMSDLFHDSVPDSFIAAVFAVMAHAAGHSFQVLTKRPERMAKALSDEKFWRYVRLRAVGGIGGHSFGVPHARLDTPLPNVWLGVSVEDQAAADERIPHLLRTPAAVRFLSCEPLLGPVDLIGKDEQGSCLHEYEDRPRIDWVIVGGESGPRARPCNVEWIRSIVRQTHEAGVACFVKQLGALPVAQPKSFAEKLAFLREGHSGAISAEGFHLALLDPKGGDPSEWPADLRVREWPGEALG